MRLLCVLPLFLLLTPGPPPEKILPTSLTPNTLYTYGENRGPDGRRSNAIGVTWTWVWDPVDVTTVVRWVGNDSTAYQTEARSRVWVPRITGKATIYSQDNVWQQDVELIRTAQ